MKECCLKSFRFSIVWTRILPEGEGEVNPAGIDFYNRVIDEMVANHIEPVVTLYHFDLPQILVDTYNGFVSRKCIDAFVKYAKVCFEYFGDRVKYWLTINEQMVITQIPSFQAITSMKEAYQAFHHMNIAHALVTKLYRSMHLKGKIGPCISYTTRLPATFKSSDVLLSCEQDDFNVFSLIDVHVYGKYPPTLSIH